MMLRSGKVSLSILLLSGGLMNGNVRLTSSSSSLIIIIVAAAAVVVGVVVVV